MALPNTLKHLKDLLGQITSDLDKAEGGNKAASQRVRTGTVKLEKTAKLYRKESIQNERKTKGTKKSSSKKASFGTKSKASAKPATKSKGKTSHKAASKATPRALSFKRPTAKLPFKRASFAR